MAREFYCNKCGKKLDIWDTQGDFSIQRHLGYGSRYDGANLDLDLCCDCMDKIIEECAIPPIEMPRNDRGDDCVAIASYPYPD